MYKTLIDAEMKLLDITNEDLAEAIGLSENTLSHLRNGTRKTYTYNQKLVERYLEKKMVEKRKFLRERIDSQLDFLGQVSLKLQVLTS